MAKLSKLITYAYLKEECDLPVHLQDDELDHKIYRAQEMLRSIMGDEFYQDYLTKFSTSTMTTLYSTLYQYIKQYVAWQAHEFWLFKAQYKVTRGGIRIHTEANSTPATEEQLGPILKDAKYQAEYYKRLLSGYLKAHATDYPLYNTCGCHVNTNVFHISVVRNKTLQPQLYGTGSYKRCCND